MKLKFKVIFLLTISSFLIFKLYSDDMNNINTTLIVLEETENQVFLSEKKPISDGIFDALWDKETIFFDYLNTNPLKFNLNDLDIRPFLRDTREAGADSLLIIKINYNTTVVDSKIKIEIKEVYYNLYSLYKMKSIRAGNLNSKYQDVVDVNQKNAYLKKVGYDILNLIFQ